MGEGKILIFGRCGQVGGALASLLKQRCTAVDREQADFTRPDTLADFLTSMNPAVVINGAAYTQVDQAEQERELARLINAEAPGALARWCAAHDRPFIHYSTDYVFSGAGERPWVESDSVAPLNVYGTTKQDGERRIASAGGRWMILRTSWVFDAAGKNFLNTMLRLGAEREVLRVVEDQHGAPTYAPHLAEATIRALDAALALPSFPSGIYHLCGSGETTWHGFATAIFERARLRGVPLQVKQVEAIPSSSFPTPALRPLNSRLDTSKAASVLGVRLPDWTQGLEECLALKA